MNTYAYVGGNPLTRTDPRGTVFISPVPGVLGDADNPNPPSATLKCEFRKRWKENFKRTNATVPGLIAPAGAGFLTARTVARGVGGLTWGEAIMYWGTEAQGVAIASAGITAMANAAIVGVTWEVGIRLGSAAYTYYYECQCGDE